MKMVSSEISSASSYLKIAAGRGTSVESETRRNVADFAAMAVYHSGISQRKSRMIW
jgi:hypothetical protein